MIGTKAKLELLSPLFDRMAGEASSAGKRYIKRVGENTIILRPEVVDGRWQQEPEKFKLLSFTQMLREEEFPFLVNGWLWGTWKDFQRDHPASLVVGVEVFFQDDNAIKILITAIEEN